MRDRRSDAFRDGRYESADTRSSLSSVEQYLPMPGNPLDLYDGASSVNTGRSRSGEYYVDAVPGSTPPPSSSQSYLHCPRQSLKRRSVNTLMNDVSEQIQGKPGQAAPISAPRMKHPIMPTLSQIISSCDVKVIIICILVGIIMTTSMWDTVTLPQPGTYIWFLAGSVPIALFAYMFYLLLQDHKRQGSESYQDRRDDPLPTRNVVPPSVVSSLSTAPSDKSSLYSVDIVLNSLRRIGAAASSIASFSAWGTTPYGEGQSAEQQEVSVGSLPSILPSHRHISPSSLRLNMNGLSRDPHNWNVQEVMRFFRYNKDWLMNLQIGFDPFIEKLYELWITGEDLFDSKNFNETFLEEHLNVKQGMGRKRLMKLVKKLRESYPKPVKPHAGDHKAQDNTGVSIKQGDHNTNNVNNVHHHYSGKINTINHHPLRLAHDQGPQEI